MRSGGDHDLIGRERLRGLLSYEAITLRLVGAVLMEIRKTWEAGGKYLTMSPVRAVRLQARILENWCCTIERAALIRPTASRDGPEASLPFQAVGHGSIDVGAGNPTDGRIEILDLAVVKDAHRLDLPRNSVVRAPDRLLRVRPDLA